MSNRTQEGPDALVSFVAALYQELFSAIVAQINKTLAGNASSWITVSSSFSKRAPRCWTCPAGT